MSWVEIQKNISQLSSRLNVIEERDLKLSYIPPEFLTHWVNQLLQTHKVMPVSKTYNEKINNISSAMSILDNQTNEISRLKSSLNDMSERAMVDASKENIFAWLKIRIDLQTTIGMQCSFIKQTINEANAITDDHLRASKKIKPADSDARENQLNTYLERLDAILISLNKIAQPNELNVINIAFNVSDNQHNRENKPKSLKLKISCLRETYSHEFQKTNRAGFFGSAKLMVKSMLQSTKTREEQMGFLLSLNASDNCTDDHRIAAIDFVLTAISQERHGAHSTLAKVLRDIKGGKEVFMTTDDLKVFISANHIELPESMAVQILKP